MHFSVQVQQLAALIKRLTAVVPSKPLIPTHGSIKVLSREPGVVRFYTYSPTIVTEGSLKTPDIGGSFEFGTNVQMFANLVASLPKTETAHFSVDGRNLIVRAGKSSYKLFIFSEDVFLPPRDYSLLPYIDLDMAKFVEGLKKVSFCVETKHDRVERSSVCINSDHFVATDGYRLSYFPNRLFKTPHDLLLSSGTVESLQKLYDKSQPKGHFSGSDVEVVLECDGVYSSSRLVAGRYPNYRAVIPTTAHTRCLVDRQPLIEALSRVMVLMGGDVLRAVRFTFLENRAVLFTSDKDHGEGMESVECECPGEANPYTLNGDYVLEALKKYSGDKVVFELRRPEDPFIITDGEHVNVIVPIRSPG